MQSWSTSIKPLAEFGMNVMIKAGKPEPENTFSRFKYRPGDTSRRQWWMTRPQC